MRGRKKEIQPYNENVSIKVTKEQKDIWLKNKWIADEIRDLVRKRLEVYSMKK